MTRISSTLVALSVGLVSLQAVAAQQLIPTSLPSCAQSCAILQQASQSCMSNPSAAESCFCQSSLLQSVKSAPGTNVCNGFCSASDWASIASWYSSTCANGGKDTAVSATTAAAGATAAAGGQTIVAATGVQGTSAPTSGSTSNQGASGADTSSGNNNDGNPSDYNNGQQWWATHYQWVIMLIVLLLVFGLAGAGGAVWYRRRQRTRARSTGAFAGGSASQWAPNGSTHDFNAAAERQARSALAAQPGSMGGAAMVERGNSRKGKNPVSSILRKKSVR